MSQESSLNTIPTLAEILAGPVPDPCFGPMVSEKPQNTIGISTFTDDEKKVFHYLQEAHDRTNLFFVRMEQRRIALQRERSSKPFDLNWTRKETARDYQENTELGALRIQEEALFEIFFQMLYFRLTTQIPPGAIVVVYENYEIGYRFFEEEED